MADKEYAIALDVGGTKTRVALVDNDLKIYSDMTEQTPSAKSGKDIVEFIVGLVKKIRSQTDKPIKGIGIGTPGFVMPDGKMTSTPNILHLNGFKLEKELRKRIDFPFVIENDANCFALSEALYGAGKGKKNVVGVIIGTGLGFGLILNKTLYAGSLHGAGEFNHSFGDPDKKSRLRDYCSGATIAERYSELVENFNGDAKDVFASKSKEAKFVVDQFYRNMALAFSYIVNLLNPDVFVLGGGISKSVNVRKMKKLVNAYCYPSFKGSFDVVKNKLGDSSGIFGAAHLVFSGKII